MNQNADIRPSLLALQKALSVLALTGALWLLTYWPTLSSMVGIWLRSDTYAHGAIIPLLSAWLIWRKRTELSLQPITPFWPATILIIGNTLIWLLATAVDVMAIAQLAIVVQIPLLVLFIMGWHWTTTITFPLIYLLFMVPIGEELTLPLQNITADFTVTFLQLTGIPVYINGLFIEIPSGKFEVAEACSGIRYLIASFAIGTLYAYLSYNSMKKRLVFILASLIVPIVANGIRAYLIVMIAHLSDMKYATGVDHLVYGWVFFGFIMAIMFWVGSYWQDPLPTDDDQENPQKAATITDSSLKPLAMVCSFLVVLFGVSYLGLANLSQKPGQVLAQTIAVQLPLWQEIEQSSPWKPKFHGADNTYQQKFRSKDGDEIELYIANYQFEDQGKELVNSTNRLQREDYWTVAEKSAIGIEIGGQEQKFNLLELRALDGSKRRILSWYNVIGRNETNEIKIKMIQAVGKLLGWGQGGTVYAIATDYESQTQAKRYIEQFLNDNWTAITGPDVIVAKNANMTSKDRGS